MAENEVERAMAIGHENEELIALGRAWCTNIRTDRTGLGVGMVEEMTGLPITGGRFTCDFARRPVGLTGMRLVASAIPFYEDNCRGCEHRSPGDRVPNLGTWAEPQIEERDRGEEEARAAQAAADDERRGRAAHRSLVAGRLDAFAQEVVGHVNALDANRSDVDAAEALRMSARLTPDAFCPDLVDLLSVDAQTLRSPVLLDVLITLQGEEDPEGLHELCARAVTDGWGRAEGCRHLAIHGRPGDLNDEFLSSVIFEAAPSGWSMGERPGRPAALHHFHSVAPEAVEQAIAVLLRHGESWYRAAGGAAAESIGSTDSNALGRLLPALLDALRYQEDPFDNDDATENVGAAVARLLEIAPDVVGAAIDNRWAAASPALRTRLLSCLDQFVRHAQQEAPLAVAVVVIGRAVSVLFEPYDGERSDLDEDYQHRASYLLKYAVAHAPTEALSLDVLLGLLLVWIERQREITDWSPTNQREFLQKMGSEAQVGGFVRDIAEAVVVAGHRDRASFVAVCRDVLAGATSPDVRAELTRMLGEVASATTDHLGDALPMIYTAMLGDDQAVRAAGLQAATAVMKSLPGESIPPTLCQTVVAALTDQYLIVVIRATEAAHYVPVDAVNARNVAVNLLLVGQAYAADRLRDRLVRDAVTGALRFARTDPDLYPIAVSAALAIVGTMPPHSARDALCWIRSLRDAPGWADAAIRALRPDDDPRFEHLGDDDKHTLLSQLALAGLTPQQIEDLYSIEKVAARHDRGRALLGADTLAELGRCDLASSVLQEHLDQIPDTIERRTARTAVRLLVMQFDVEVAVARGDLDRLRAIGEEVTELAASSKSD